ncbi:hypothetical protein PWT90_03509 [Aphanocladium album]|nr:hypothetical protein PWT90_03509 [Aphanocladium album]
MIPTRNKPDHKPTHIATTPPRRPSDDAILSIIREYSRFPLFVPPWRWTDRHASLLGVRFNELPRCDAPSPTHQPCLPPSRGHMQPSPTIETLCHTLTSILSQDIENPVNAIQTIMVTLWPDCFYSPIIAPELSMNFGDKVYQGVARSQVMWTYPCCGNASTRNTKSSFASTQARDSQARLQSPSPASLAHTSPGTPMLCYMDMEALASIREKTFRVHPAPNGQSNEPVSRLQLLHCRNITPKKPEQDAYIAGVLLAMAQNHSNSQHLTLSKDELSAKDAKSCMHTRMRLMTHDRENAELIVYTGHVTFALLERFRRPRKVPIGYDHNSIGMTIDYVRVPIWPILGLRERLGKALGEDIVGVFNQEAMETWVEDAVPLPGGSRKRKRDGTETGAGTTEARKFRRRGRSFTPFFRALHKAV